MFIVIIVEECKRVINYMIHIPCVAIVQSFRQLFILNIYFHNYIRCSKCNAEFNKLIQTLCH